MYVHTYIHAHARMYVRTHVRTHVCMYACMHACMYLYMYVCLFLIVNVKVFNSTWNVNLFYFPREMWKGVFFLCESWSGTPPAPPPFKLIWAAIAGDTSLITPPPPPSGFKPGVQTSNPARSLDKPWCHVMDQNHNIPDCPTFRCYNNTNINWMARRAFLSLPSKINSNRPNQWWEITHN